MSAEAQGAAGSQQLSLGVDVERLQKQHDIGSDLPADMQKAITEPDLRFFISILHPEKMKIELSFPIVVRLTYQRLKPLMNYLDICSDRSQSHLLKKIFSGQRPRCCCDVQFLCSWGLQQPWTLPNGCAGISAAHTTGGE